VNTLVLNEDSSDLIRTFDCGDEGLNNYLKEQALIDQKNNESTTTLIVKKYRGQRCLLGYYTLKNTSLLLKHDEKLRGYPAIEIVYFAIQREHQHQHIGSIALGKIIYQSYCQSRDFSAIKVIILSSKECAVEFYRKNEFEEMNEYLEMLYDDCRTVTTPMFLTLNVE